MRSNVPCGMAGAGVVIRAWLPEKKTCLVFDRLRGMVSAILLQPESMRHVQHGALISYEISSRGSFQGDRFFLQQVQLCAQPAEWAHQDILFVHHVLELCASFVPPHLGDRAVFEHMLGLYNPLNGYQQDPVLGRLVFLVQFFLLIGWYPDEDTSAINRLISRVPGTMVTVREQEFLRSSLVKWLRRCVALHPLAPSFKTVTFFEVVRYYEL